MPVADLEILRRDLAVYLTTIVRILNAPLHPFDYGAAAEEMRDVVAKYHAAAAGEVDLQPVVDDLEALAVELRRWRSDAEARVRESPGDAAERRRFNTTLRQLARHLVSMNYARGERFDHDPATKFGAVPRLEGANTIGSAAADVKPFLRVGLVRERNKVRATIRAARRQLRASSDASVVL